PGIMANIYNIVPQNGPGLYNSQLYLLALSIGIAAGERLGEEPAYLDALRADLSAAKTEFELVFWNPLTSQYRFSTGSPYAESLFIDAFFAQHVARDLGLPDLINPNRHKAHLIKHTSGFWRYDDDGEMIGAPMLHRPGGFLDLPPEVTWVWPGTDYVAAADLYDSGERFGSPVLKEYALKLGSAIATQIWLEEENGYAFNPPCGWSEGSPGTAWYPAYSHVMAVWDLMHAIKPLGG
ncbi:MAG TPA: GH116 family glycosyl hydrolase, partial [Pseudolysinimonas sp.]|nr:GH116 family glycosyl hydrolase [Pseudolysinimonas sp.]